MSEKMRKLFYKPKMEEIKMEYEYRDLSEKKAEEIDSQGFTDNLGKKVSINAIESVTNKEESVVYRQIWYSHEKEEPDDYILVYRDDYYFIEIFKELRIEKIKNCKYYYDTYDITSIASRGEDKVEDDLLEEVLEVLKNVIPIWNQHNSGRMNPEDKLFTEVLFKGEAVK